MPAVFIRDLSSYATANPLGYLQGSSWAIETSSPVVAPAHAQHLIGTGNVTTLDSIVFRPRSVDSPSPGSGGFCVEGFFKTPVVSKYYSFMYCGEADNLVVQTIAGGADDGKLRVMSFGSPSLIVLSAAPLVANTLYHWAVFRISGRIYLSLNGVNQPGSYAHATSYTSGGFSFNLGWSPYGTEAVQAIHAGIRFTANNSRYTTSTFTPPASFVAGGADPFWSGVSLLSDMYPLGSVGYEGPAAVVEQAQPGTLTPGYRGPVGAQAMSYSLADLTGVFSSEYGGLFKITGFTNVGASPDYPVKRRVRLYTQDNGRLVMETFSDETTGAYLFDWIRGDRKYMVISEDYQHVFNAVIADNITPEAR